MIATQDSSAYASELTGKPAQLVLTEAPGVPKGNPNDATRRRSITGPCRVKFKDAYRTIYEEIMAERSATS